MTKKSKEEILAEMDAAAQDAIKDFEANIAHSMPHGKTSAEVVVEWVHKWYLTAGYKRLMRYLFATYRLE